jgi:hypothetical protein
MVRGISTGIATSPYPLKVAVEYDEKSGSIV